MKTKFYVMHYKKNVERRARLEPILEEMGIDATWYTDYDKNELSEELFSERFREDLNLCFGIAKRLPKDD